VGAAASASTARRLRSRLAMLSQQWIAAPSGPALAESPPATAGQEGSGAETDP